MGCNCKWMEIIISVVILVFAIWPELIPGLQGSWVVIVAAALLLIHALMCKNCGACMPEKKVSSSKGKKKR
jgi:hypothetical protein